MHWFMVHIDFQMSPIADGNFTIHESYPVIYHILPGEPDVFIHRVNVICELQLSWDLIPTHVWSICLSQWPSDFPEKDNRPPFLLPPYKSWLQQVNYGLHGGVQPVQHLSVTWIHLALQYVSHQTLSQPSVSPHVHKKRPTVCIWLISNLDKCAGSRAADFTKEHQTILWEKYEEIKHKV